MVTNLVTGLSAGVKRGGSLSEQRDKPLGKRPEPPSQQHPVTQDVAIQTRIKSAIADHVNLAAKDLLERLLQPKHVKEIGAHWWLHQKVHVGVHSVIAARRRAECGKLGETATFGHLAKHCSARCDEIARARAIRALASQPDS